MDWVTITSSDVLAEGFSATEQAALTAAGNSGVGVILTSAIGEWRGVIEAADHDLDADTTKVPPSCKPHIIAQVRWRWLISLSQLKQLQTEERKQAAERADEILDAIAEGDRAVEEVDEDDDDVGQGGAWGSKTYVPMRMDND